MSLLETPNGKDNGVDLKFYKNIKITKNTEIPFTFISSRSVSRAKQHKYVVV